MQKWAVTRTETRTSIYFILFPLYVLVAEPAESLFSSFTILSRLKGGRTESYRADPVHISVAV